MTTPTMLRWTSACLTSLLLALAPRASAEEKKPEPKAEAPAHGKSEQPKALENNGPTDFYVHRWIPLPSFTGAALGEEEGQTTVKARKGRATVVLFLASWCEPCQQMVTDFLKLSKRYQKLDTDVVYVFAHDTREDAEGFMKEYGIKAAILGNQEILKAFHNPELPTVYVGDRHGWLGNRFARIDQKELETLDGYLRNLTAL